jgi:O-antigen/teichoic acid export membrane protein
MVKAFIDTTALGQYSLSVSLAEASLLAADSLAITLLPQQTAARLQDAARLGLTGAKIGGVVTAVIAVPSILLGPVLIPFLFGRAFEPSYAPFALLLPGMVWLAIQRYCGAPALRANQPFRLARIFLVGVLVNLALNLWWLPAFGIIGASLATTVSYAVTTFLFVRWMKALATAGTNARPRRWWSNYL